MNHFKLFNQHTNYESWTETEDYIEPSLSYCELENEWHFNRAKKPDAIITINVPEHYEYENNNYYSLVDNPPFYICLYAHDWANKTNNIKYIKIDGVKYDNNTLYLVSPNTVSYYYYPLSIGEHTVEYFFNDPTLFSSQFTSYAPSTHFNLPEISTSLILSDNITTFEGFSFQSFCNINYHFNLPSNLSYIGPSTFSCLENNYNFTTEERNRLNEIALNTGIEISSPCD